VIPRLQRADERYVRVPQRVFEALERAEISQAKFGILVYLLWRADGRTEVACTIRSLADGLQFRPGVEQLRRELVELRRGRWIDYSSTQGQRRPYVIRLGRAALVLVGDSTSTAAPPADEELEVSAKKSPPPEFPSRDSESMPRALSWEKVTRGEERETYETEIVPTRSVEEGALAEALAAAMGNAPAPGTDAYRLRRQALMELKRHQATPELIELTAVVYCESIGRDKLTDAAFARHYPRLAADALRRRATSAAVEARKAADESFFENRGWAEGPERLAAELEKRVRDGLSPAYAAVLLEEGRALWRETYRIA
jgi:hypothetical protein